MEAVLTCADVAARVGRAVRTTRQAQTNQEAQKHTESIGTRGGQAGNQNARKTIPGTNSDTNKKDITIRFQDGRGTSTTYALRRLAKHRPDLHAQCLAGELTPQEEEP
jgi:hypothetical protein